MKRKFKITTAGIASLALLTPIATVIACGDPNDKGDKMLSLDELQTAFGKTANHDNEATKEQKAKIKEIFDTFKIEKSKAFTVPYEGKNKDGGKVTYHGAVNLYLITKPGDKLKEGTSDSFKDFSDDSKHPWNNESYKYIRDNFLQESNLDKYFIMASKSDKGNKGWYIALTKIIKQADKVGSVRIDYSALIN